MCSATGNEDAQESHAHKHGVFTVALLEGLAGKAGKTKDGAAYLLALARCGQHAEAGRGPRALGKEASGSPELLAQLARCYVACAGASRGEEVRGYTAGALAALHALAAVPGYRDVVALRTDPD